MTEKRRQVTDLELLEIIEKYDDAERICEEAGIKKSTLKRRWADLMAIKGEYIPIKGLITPPDEVTTKATGVNVSMKVLLPIGYKPGDRFKISYDKKAETIILKHLA
jgi:hypothetical protein